MNNFAQGIYNLVSKIQPYTYLLLAAALILIGIGCIVPSENIRKASIKSIPIVAIGAAIVLLALPLAKEIAATFTF